jgi:hypothetical protein
MAAANAQTAMERSAIRLAEIKGEYERNKQTAAQAHLQFAAAATKASANATALALAASMPLISAM